MYRGLLSVILFLLGNVLLSQTLDDLSFGTDNTLEVVTWNVEKFPKSGTTTVNAVIEVIKKLDVDILALQEVRDTNSFRQMVNNLQDFEAYVKSSYNDINLAYIYKTGSITIKNIYEIYTTSPYWSAFPRAPMIMELVFNNEEYVIINNHYKCCGDGYLNLSSSSDEETRRFNASNLLKQYIEANFADKKVVVVGDLNDEITDNNEHNVFRPFLDDADNFKFADMDIANGVSSDWSYPSWPSHIDHILITNELFDYIVNTETIKIDSYLSGGFSEYDSKMTDHRPVGVKISNQPTVLSSDLRGNKSEFYSYPNPATEQVNFFFNASETKSKLTIHNTSGAVVYSEWIDKRSTYKTWSLEGISSGVYYAKIIYPGKGSLNKKVIVVK